MNPHARRARAGTRVLGSRLLDWLAADRWRTVAARLTGLAAAGWMLGGMILAAPLLLVPTVAAWLVAAWRIGRAAERQEANELAFVQLLADLIGDRNGVLLADVLAVVQAHDPRADAAAVRAQCEALDIPVRDSLKVAGRVSPGVHRDDLLAVWDAEPSPAPPGTVREWHAAVTSDNYPTTPEG